MKALKVLVVAGTIVSLGACVQGKGDKEVAGTLIGAAAGGLIGSQIGSGSGQLVAVGAGVLLGGLLGSEVGRSLDKADQAYAAQTYNQTLEHAPVGQTNTWVNPDSGNEGSYTPVKTYQADSGQYCREFQQTITVSGQTESAYGTACRQPDGTWQIVSN
ncbi:MAG: RT0821/Lpp0805 family surface protein [Alphaproteobacteria bacterium]|jgi:surface antigen|nr:RT0821/Lpp0805 family surface protein [Alphaproteobacteria bacterium]